MPQFEPQELFSSHQFGLKGNPFVPFQTGEFEQEKKDTSLEDLECVKVETSGGC